MYLKKNFFKEQGLMFEQASCLKGCVYLPFFPLNLSFNKWMVMLTSSVI